MSLSLSTLLYSQNFNFEQGQQTTGNRGADTIVRYLMTNLGAGSVGFAGRNPTDTFYLYSDGDSTYWTADKNLVLKPQNGGGIVRIDGQIKISGGNPSNGFILTTDANGLCTFAPPPSIPTQFSVTYAQADSLSNAGALVTHAWYNITDESVYLLAASDTAFELDGYYADSTIWEVDAIQYDFPNQHIQQRCDRRGNCVGATFNVIAGYGITDPITVFAWGEDMVAGNTVKDATLNLTGFQNLVIGLVVTGQSEAIITTTEFCQNSHFGNGSLVSIGASSNVNGSVFEATQATFEGNASANNMTAINSIIVCNGVLGNSILVDADVTINDTASCADCVINGSTISLSNNSSATFANITQESQLTLIGDVIATSVIINGGSIVSASDSVNCSRTVISNSTVLASGKSDFTDSDISDMSDLTLSDSILAQGLISKASTIIGSGGAAFSFSQVVQGSLLTISDTAIAIGIKLLEANTATLSGTSDATAVKMYTGAELTASGKSWAEGAIIYNVSQVIISDSARIGTTEIFHQSTVIASGNAYLANGTISSCNLTFIDSAFCQNCYFEGITDTLDTTLDRNIFTNYNGIQFIKTVDVDTFYLTDGTQGAGKVLTDVTGNGKGTWQDPAAYGEMGFGDSSRTIALTQNVFSVVTNSNNTLWSTAAIDLHNVTYSGDSLIIDSAGTYQVNIQLSMDGTGGSVIRLGVFLNGVLACSCTGYQELLNNRIMQIMYLNTETLNAGDVLQVVITNTANNDDVDAVGGKLMVNKIR